MSDPFTQAEAAAEEDRRYRDAQRAARGVEPAPTGAPRPPRRNAVAGVVAIAVVGIVACIAILPRVGGSGAETSSIAPAVTREINKAGAYGFAGYDAFQGVNDEGHGDIAIRTNLFDKPENEQAARYMCSSMMTIRLQDGLEDLGQVRILSSADTTLAYCD